MGDLKLKTIDAGKSRSLRKDGSPAHINGSTLASISATGYGIATASDTYEYTQDVYSNGSKVAQVKDIWYKVRKNYDSNGNLVPLPTGSPVDANGAYLWTAGVHLGVAQLIVEPVSPTQPPVEPTFPPSIWVAIEEGGEQKKYDLGV